MMENAEVRKRIKLSWGLSGCIISCLFGFVWMIGVSVTNNIDSIEKEKIIKSYNLPNQ